MKQTPKKTDPARRGVANEGRRPGATAPLDIHAEGRAVWEAFRTMSEEMPAFESLKRSPDFEYLDGIKDGVNLYTYFPFLFAETFPALGRQVFSELSLMSLLYVHHIIIADSLMDGENNLPPESILVSNACSMRALEILAGLFGERPLPWRQITELHQQYSQATALDKQPAGRELHYSFEDLLTRLSRKSAMAKLIPLALCSLSGRGEYLKPLMRSFDLYYLSEQLVDDFRDWKKDWAAGRHSYLLTSVVDACGLREKVAGLSAERAVQVVGKHLYLSGLAEDYLLRAIGYCEQAKDCLRDIECPRWTGFLDTFQMGIHVTRSSISERARQLFLQADKYDYGLLPEGGGAAPSEVGARPGAALAHPIPSVSRTVSHAARRAADFLREGYKPGVGFADFMMARGQLSVWVSGYVGASLLDWMGRAGVEPERGRTLRRTLKRLGAGLVNKRVENGWAPSAYAPADADTSVWVLDFLFELGGAERRAARDAAGTLLRYRRPDGGFSTYLPEALGRNAEGYTGSHAEVTAAVVSLLLKAGLDPDDEAIRGALSYLRERRGADGLWQAYWWDGQMFATYHCLRALRAGRTPLDGRAREQTVAAIIAGQGRDGSWGETTVGKNKAFETALALKSLMLIDGSLAVTEVVKGGVAWLLNHQARDGGSNSGPAMRVPFMDEKEPWARKEWVLDSVGGFGTLSRDQNRLFTTSTVLSALTDFLALAGDHRTTINLKRVQGRQAAAPVDAAAVPGP